MLIRQGRYKLAWVFMLTGFGTTLAFAATTHQAPNKSLDKHSLTAYMASHRPKLEVQLGGFVATQGNSQDIHIQGLIGDHFSVNHRYAANVLMGAGLYFDGPTMHQTSFSYGINAFYLPHTTVEGTISQEQVFTNLAYRYTLTNMPVYFAGKARLNDFAKSPYTLTLSGGVGPNFIRTGNVNERSLDNGFTIPDTAFSGRTTTAFSAMVGVGVEFKNVFKQVPVECGYRFFYLGQSSFSKRTDQLINTLKTGNNFANALTCSVIF
jgi:hypothetical protein